MAAHNQRGLPAFSIYGHDVQDMNGFHHSLRRAGKNSPVRRCACAVGVMKNKAYVGIGSGFHGHHGLFLQSSVLPGLLGIRAEWVDMTEVLRRMKLEIYDHEEFERALAWTKAHCPEGLDKNPPEKKHTDAQKEEEWAFVVKMTLICRDLMLGNP